jgi:hypothetical protein
MSTDPNDVDVIPTPIEQVRTGWTLATNQAGRPGLFQVDKVTFSFKPGEGTLYTMESEPVDGKVLRIQGPPGTITHRIVTKH